MTKHQLIMFTDYIQEAGRAGEPAVATIYANSSDLAASNVHLTEDMKEYCKTKNCRRQLLMSYFGFEAVEIVPKHMCCDNCKDSCICNDCKESEEKTELHMKHLFVCKPKPNVEVMDTIKYTLSQYFICENSVISDPFPEILTGLCSDLASDIAANYVFKTHIDLCEFREQYPNISHSYAKNIVDIINHVITKYQT